MDGYQKTFIPVVLVRERHGDRDIVRVIGNVRAAAEAMASWPRHGDTWASADYLPKEAVRDRATVEDARQAFEAAAIEAGVFMPQD